MAKIMAAMYFGIGLLFVPFLLLAGLAGLMGGKQEAAFAGIGAVVLAVLAPFVYGTIGFIGGAISALLYNLFAKWTGGIQVQLLAPSTTVQASAAGSSM